jgi:hypothetical protein
MEFWNRIIGEVYFATDTIAYRMELLTHLEYRYIIDSLLDGLKEKG